uniref:Dual specificity protein phosphatase 12 n=1 Tax=Geotrypetes seraphini TaxID=260995 RepID=A0A6P8SNS1_GEOSA|nr:dual specificity protein phosphatase 12 [Geotrypetes seraphini]XP_033817938.1 dual specificity protein phosphatase 12 [Geotrypetes seraphini]
MIFVLPRLFLGSAADAADPGCLQEAGVTHVLTVDAEKPQNLEAFKTKFVHALDDASTDLLSCLDECVAFVNEVLATDTTAILIHCHSGVSRSVAVVTAYLMKSLQLTFPDAYARLQATKSDVSMNEGFVNQLKLYEAMGCNVDVTSSLYKHYRLQMVMEKYPELQNLPREVFAVDPTSTCQTSLSGEILYRCRKCRRALFRSSSILNHTYGSGPLAFTHKRLSSGEMLGAEGPVKCTSYFIEPVRWMEPTLLGVLDGQLLCPKCSWKLGSFNWYGVRCSCARWVTPAFQIHKNRVDEILPVYIPGLQKGKI